MPPLDAIVVGSGPNGLAAAITIAQAGRRVVVLEANETIGGGCRSGELTLPGFVHDVCSAVHPLAIASPFFQSLPLATFGVDWVHPPVPVAHPLDDGRAAWTERSVEQTAEHLGVDGPAYKDLFAPLVDDWPRVAPVVFGPPALPRHPFALARFGLKALRSAEGVARRFRAAGARALIAGHAGHGMLPLDMSPGGGVALVLNLLAHVVGWPIPRGGAQRLTDALVGHLRVLGGEIITSHRVTSLDELPASRAVLCDLSPRPFLRIAGNRLPPRYRRALEHYRYGMGVFKVDWALDAPIPWRHPACARAGTVHLGGTLEEIAESERDAWDGRVSERPYVLLSQPTLFDASRAPAGKHVAWAYCHVPHGSEADMLPRIERQVERFAPGFRDRILACAVRRPADLEHENANYVGGDIAAGVVDLRQFATRPTWRTYSTPVRGLYLCSAATPPGVGVHGLCGHFAARRALRDVLTD